MDEYYISRVVKTDHSIITVKRPIISEEERERRYKLLEDTVKEVYARRR